MWSTPCARATSIVRSVEPSSITSHSTVVEAGDLARQVGERQRERLLLVEAGDLDDQLHGRERGDLDVASRLAPQYSMRRPDRTTASPLAGVLRSARSRLRAVGDPLAAAVLLQRRRGRATSSRCAVGFFGHGLNPHYFLNPPGYTSCCAVVYAVWFGGRGGRRARVRAPTRPRCC